MSVVAGPAEHHEIAVYFSGEQNSVTVKRQKGVFQLDEGFEILCLRYGDSRPVEVIAPGNVIRACYLHQSWVVTVKDWLCGRTVFIEKCDNLFFNFPTNTVLASTQMQIGIPVLMVGPENADKFALIRDDGTVKNSARIFQRVQGDYRILVISPNNA